LQNIHASFRDELAQLHRWEPSARYRPAAPPWLRGHGALTDEAHARSRLDKSAEQLPARLAGDLPIEVNPGACCAGWH
jgi:hypothetical protein